MATPNTARAIQAVEACLKAADVLYSTNLSGNVRIRCDIRGFRAAGQARCSRVAGVATNFELRLHPAAIEDYIDEMVQNTIPHEVAHLVNYARPATGRRHNKGWKRVCLALGGNAKRCHSLDIGDRSERQEAYDARRPYVYIDSKGTERRITKHRHTAIQDGKWIRRHGVKYFTKVNYTYPDNKGRIDLDSEWRHEPVNVISNTKGSETKRKVAKRNGGMTKAQIARNLIKLHFPAGPDQLNQEQIIAKIADVCGLSKGLAKTYFKNNLAKVV